ncbi:MAG: MltA domain-containing protein [Thermodesulfobacteriota bacterium]
MPIKPLLKTGLTVFLIFLSSCSFFLPKTAERIETVGFEKVPDQEWPQLEDDLDLSGLEQALGRSLDYYRNQPPDRSFSLGIREVSVEELLDGLLLFQETIRNNPDRSTLRRQLHSRFDLYRPIQNDAPVPVLLTGYYEPTLQGSRKPSSRFRHPVYSLPDDLLIVDLEKFSKKYEGQKLRARLEDHRVLPYFSRKEIDQDGRLEGRNLEIVWVDDALKLFFMHIQGSGQVRLEDGSLIKLGYHGTNGQAYFPVGRELIRRGAIKAEDMSLQSIYAYLKDHPEEQAAVLNLNPSYVFFRERENGPYGSLGLPLAAGRSVAADQKIFPPAGLFWLSGWKPVLDEQGQIRSWVPFSRWVCVHDSGGAIKGPARIDLFTGEGEEAETTAGHLRHQGTFFLLLKKEKGPDL